MHNSAVQQPSQADLNRQAIDKLTSASVFSTSLNSICASLSIDGNTEQDIAEYTSMFNARIATLLELFTSDADLNRQAIVAIQSDFAQYSTNHNPDSLVSAQGKIDALIQTFAGIIADLQEDLGEDNRRRIVRRTVAELDREAALQREGNRGGNYRARVDTDTDIDSDEDDNEVAAIIFRDPPAIIRRPWRNEFLVDRSDDEEEKYDSDNEQENVRPYGP